ncbi:MAG: FAD-binding oxidoreductase [Alphaproteobacteria bacterium]|jgi:sarcosine oxidase subunit beta|nr:FAD-binding oxidoreductase [Alphaproteobacteria bacterium]
MSERQEFEPTENTADAVVIGAGIIGCAVAFALAQDGRDVVVVDKNPAAGYGSTSSSTAIVRTFYSTREGCALAWEGLHIWRDWAAFLGHPEGADLARYVECGTLVLRNGEDDGMDRMCRHLSALGIAWESWDRERLSRQYPGFDMRSFAPTRRADDERFGEDSGRLLSGALHFPDGGYVPDPQLAARNMADAAQGLGSRFRFGASVVEIDRDRGRVSGVTLDTGDAIAAPVVVNAAGPYSTKVNRMAGVLDDMTIACRPLRQEICHLARPSDIGGDDGMVLLDRDIASYLRTEHANALVVGGMEPECDPPVWVDDPDDLDRNPTEQWTHQVHRQALRFPGLGIPGQAKGLVDLYDVSDDWIPIYDRSALPGFYMAVGTSGNQFKNGPVAGRLMAGLIAHCESGRDHDSEPYRFPLAYTGGTLDTAVFSRRRGSTQESSMGVLG